MSTGTVGRKVGAGLLFLVLFWPAFGWVGDIGARRRDPSNETITATMAAWTSTIFHCFGAVAVAFVSPLWALCWGLFAAFVLANRLGARRGIGVPMSAWARNRNSRIALAVCGALPPLWAVSGNDVLMTLAAGSIPVALGIVGVGAAKYTAEMTRTSAAYEEWVETLVGAWGTVTADDFRRSGFHENGVGIVISPVSESLARKFDAATFDTELAASRDDLEIGPGSTSKRIVIQGVTDATRARRALLASSGGLIAGVGAAPAIPERVSRHADTSVYQPTEGEALVISLEDL